MSLLQSLFGMQAQAPGAMSQPTGIGRILAPEVALPMAAGLLGNGSNAQNFAQGFAFASPALQEQKQLQAQTAEKNKTIDFFRKNAPEFAQAIEAGMPVGEAWQTYTKQKFAKPETNDYQQRAAAAQQYGLTGEDATSFVLTGSLPTGRFGSGEVSVQGIPGYDKDGNFGYSQLSKSGNAVPTVFPKGFKPMSPFDTSQQKAGGSEFGKLQGGAQFDLPRVEQNAAQSLDVLDRMKKHPGLAGSVGFWQGMMPSRTSDQVDFQSLVDQTQGQSFLQAYNMLKGGGQITEIEGKKAENAISRLGNQRLSDTDYLQAITDLEDVIKAGLARARQQAAMGTSSIPGLGAPQGSGARLRYNPQTGELE